MDRHYTQDATRKALEDAHRKDLAIQGRYGIKFLTYWFDEDRQTAFCLVDSPDKHTISEVHNKAHGDVPNEIIEVDPGTVNAFLGSIAETARDQTGAQSTTEEGGSAVRTVMFTDLKDSTAMTTRLGDQEAMHLLHIHNTLIRKPLNDYDGREVKHTGDGFMLAFNSADGAVECAVDIQTAFANHNRNNPQEAMLVRIGMSSGVPVEENNDLFGSTVQMAARICAQADGGQILASRATVDECRRNQSSASAHGAYPLKGFPQPIELFRFDA
jgi:class 3 adenylate cyclase